MKHGSKRWGWIARKTIYVNWNCEGVILQPPVSLEMGGGNREVAMKHGARGGGFGILEGGGHMRGCIGGPRSWQDPEDSVLLEDGSGGQADVSAGAAPVQKGKVWVEEGRGCKGGIWKSCPGTQGWCEENPSSSWDLKGMSRARRGSCQHESRVKDLELVSDGAQWGVLYPEAGSKWRVAGLDWIRRSCSSGISRWRHPTILGWSCSFWL